MITPRLLALAAATILLGSCSMFRSGMDGVKAGSQATWNAVSGATGSVVSGTASLTRKTAEAAGGLVPGGGMDNRMVEMTFAFDGRRGTVLIALEDEAAPEHAANFRKLVEDGFYNGLRVHRSVRNHLIQTGDPRTRRKEARPIWGLGGPGYTLASEINLPHRRGSVGMARLGNRLNPTRQSNGSQFYICLKPIPELDGEYTVFARVVGGLDVAQAISRLSTDENDVPRADVMVESARLVAGGAAPTPPPMQAPARPSPPPEDPGPPPAPQADAPDAEASAPPPVEEQPKKRGFFGRIFNALW